MASQRWGGGREQEGFVVKPQKKTRSDFQFPICSHKKSSVEKNEPKTKRTITFVGLLKASCHGRQELDGGDPFKGGTSASVLLVRMLSVRRLGTSGGQRGLSWSCPLVTVPVTLVWRRQMFTCRAQSHLNVRYGSVAFQEGWVVRLQFLVDLIMSFVQVCMDFFCYCHK